jgi:hypothetical protein
MKKRLEIGDVIIMHNLLMGDSEHTVTRIDGNKAVTSPGLRKFNTRIYLPYGRVYEFGKRGRHWTDNEYRVKES